MSVVYLFSHIPKTAGSSLRVHLQTHLQDQLEFIHLANRGTRQAKRRNLTPFAQRDQATRNQAKVVFGHEVNHHTAGWFSDKTIKPVVMFRQPQQWEISRYNQYAHVHQRETGQTLDFDAWCDPQQVNKTHSQFDWFLAKHWQQPVNQGPMPDRDAMLQATLQDFAHVLFVEDLPACLWPIFSDLNIPSELPKSTNVVGLDKPDYFQPTQENLVLLDQICAQDLATYTRLYRSHGLG